MEDKLFLNFGAKFHTNKFHTNSHTNYDFKVPRKLNQANQMTIFKTRDIGLFAWTVFVIARSNQHGLKKFGNEL